MIKVKWDSNKKCFIDNKGNKYDFNDIVFDLDCTITFENTENVIKYLKEISNENIYDFYDGLRILIGKIQKKFLTEKTCEWITRYFEYDPYIVFELRRRVNKPSIKFLTKEKFVSNILKEFYTLIC